ncbi:uncharacterized protein J3D65DRAFT_638208 [Phyllosticta citribraziliensis]|uniref:Uncharacterized protein n=1 Tax=Phyllosticta citribraziliensis TaxID=989973 RepID=A0ABR1LAB2_9PEZI
MKHFWHEKKARRAASKIVIQGRTSRVEADAASASITIARCGVLNMSEGIRKWWYYKDRRKRGGAVKVRRPLETRRKKGRRERGRRLAIHKQPSLGLPASNGQLAAATTEKNHPRPRSVRRRWRAIAGRRLVGSRSSSPLLWRRRLGRARRVVGTTAHVGRNGGGFPSNHDGGEGEEAGVGNIAGGRVVRGCPSDGIGGRAGLVREYQNDGVVVPRRKARA